MWVPKEYFTQAFWDRLQTDAGAHYEAADFKLDRIDGGVLFYGFDTGDSQLQNVTLRATVVKGTPALGAVRLELSGRYADSIDVTAVIDYTEDPAQCLPAAGGEP